jgi:metal-sulfur cluster biosynthetic enzyme
MSVEERAMAVIEKQIMDALKTVKDPELNLNLVVLGLVYGVEIEESHVHARISLTTPMCPVAEQIVGMAEKAILGVEGVQTAKVQLTFDPPWTRERISPLIRSSLGL